MSNRSLLITVIFEIIFSWLCLFLVDCVDPNCSGHGNCDHGQCHCHAGWTGSTCGRKASDQVTEDFWFEQFKVFEIPLHK